MLIKIGHSWVSPESVICLTRDFIENDTRVVLKTGEYLKISGDPDNLAEIINNALSIQSFGNGNPDDLTQEA